ncbi:vitamin B12-dependent ribonucleotide reductase [Chlorobaculum thiosulfatiphilum]|uniref:Vitamin B12-dependent ribonucleotide reductase n=1 Tax=Chlorobaculum thiosulfatiphilum TaxID=115852 RepID=A0A5C4S6S6_CHLTI|nr:LAGLIDADG family homing endonuclease [Chlorobaculum thiosulfatiphilum]TNJ38952.1 vitamin B12-dependent ribonucleotide reductase [Chlorobaculum thiosulfatiphilum]
MKIARLFTSPGENVYDRFEYTLRTSVLRNPDGSKVFEMNDVEVPVSWSQVASDILAQKYFRKTGVPQRDAEGNLIIGADGQPVTGSENSIRQVAHRMVGCWQDWGRKHNYFDTEEDAQAFYDEVAYMLLAQMAAPNSPQWFNTGLQFAYDINGPAQGHYYVDPVTGETRESEDAYSRPQAHACFIQSIQDDLVNEGGIFDLAIREARVFKFGSGSGTNYSNLRGSGEKLSGGGSSSGLMSFLKIFDSAAGAIKSGGTTRRAAKMVIIDIDHPDIEKFIEWKAKEEDKVAAMVAGSKICSRFLKAIVDEALRGGADRQENEMLDRLIRNALQRAVPLSYILRVLALVEQGYTTLDFDEYDTHYESEAYATVGGQNSNNSVRVTNEFMKAVQNDEMWVLRERTTGKDARAVRAKDLWEKIVMSAWKCADPGLQFDSTINEWHTCPASGRINASNPCVTADTLVATDRGLERIGGLVGQSRGIKSIDGQMHWVEKIFPTGTKPVYELKTKSGYSLKLTGDHPVFTENRGDVKACELCKDDVVRLVGAEFGKETTGSAETAQLVGLLAGDGCITTTSGSTADGEPRRVAFLTVDKAEREIAEWANALINDMRPDLGEHNKPGSVTETVTTARVAVGSPRILRQLEAFAVLDAGSERKAFTDAVFRLSREEQAALLRGLFTADGTVANYGEKSQYVALDSTSLELLRQVQLLLLNFGIKAKIYENRRAGELVALLPDGNGGSKEYPVQQMHTLRISRSSRVLFEEAIGFMPESRKSDELRRLNQTVGAYNDSLTDAVASLTRLGEEPVYDLTEPETSHFVANGIAVHNCSEYMFLDDTACNLASLNLAHFLDEETGKIKITELQHASSLWTVVLEISVLMAHFPSAEIARLSYEFRTLGLGFANMGRVLMVLGIPYDSPRGLAIAGGIAALMTGQAYVTSADLAKDHGAFARYRENSDDMLRVIRNHRRAAINSSEDDYEGLVVKPRGIDSEYCPKELFEAAGKVWDEALKKGKKHGFRNAQVSVIAPTGTIGLVMDCDTTGIEPEFAIVKFKKLAGGGYFKIVNQSVHKALGRLGYTDAQIEKIEKYCKGHGTLRGCPGINQQWLKSRGFTDEKIEAVEKQLESVFDIRFAFNKWIIGEEFCRSLGFSDADLNDGGFDMLLALGATDADIEVANDYVCGTMMIEGAPHLKPEHLPVFDCASTCGRKGERYINHMAHVHMMSAVQPFISGAISKTVNMPATATTVEIGEVYKAAWQSMVKAITIYRDGSKLSQPLNISSIADLDEVVMLGTEEDLDETKGPKEVQERIVERVYHRSERRMLPKRRKGYIREAYVGGHKVFLRTGEYEDGSLGEVFIDMYKEGASFKGLLNCFAVLASKALQYGMPLEELVDSFTFTRFEPAGAVQGHNAIKNSTSILDYVFRSIGYDYLGRKDFVHVKAVDEVPEVPANGNGNGHAAKSKASEPELAVHAAKPHHDEKSVLKSQAAQARVQGYTGEQCENCGSVRVKQNGTCKVCEDCGMTTGCS